MSGNSTYSDTLTKYLQVGFGTVFGFIVAMITYLFQYGTKQGWNWPVYSSATIDFYAASCFLCFCTITEYFFCKALLRSLNEKRTQDQKNKILNDKIEKLDLEKRQLVNSLLTKFDTALDDKNIKAIVDSIIDASKNDNEKSAKLLNELLLTRESFKQTITNTRS